MRVFSFKQYRDLDEISNLVEMICGLTLIFSSKGVRLCRQSANAPSETLTVWDSAVIMKLLSKEEKAKGLEQILSVVAEHTEGIRFDVENLALIDDRIPHGFNVEYHAPIISKVFHPFTLTFDDGEKLQGTIIEDRMNNQWCFAGGFDSGMAPGDFDTAVNTLISRMVSLMEECKTNKD